MAGIPWSGKETMFIKDKTKEGLTPKDISKQMMKEIKCARTPHSIRLKLQSMGVEPVSLVTSPELSDGTEATSRVPWRESRERDSWVIESTDPRICTVEDAIAKAGVDMAIWAVEKVFVGGWDVTMKIKDGDKEKPFRSQNQMLRVVLKRKVPVVVEDAVERLLDRLRGKAPAMPNIKRPKRSPKAPRRALELCLMDPHYGMRCFTPESDAAWSPDKCASMVLDSLDELMGLAEQYAPFDQIIMPLGNDFFHADNLWQTTTKGTPQPEADAYHHTFIGGETLAIEIVDRVKKIAPVVLYMVPGNHDRATSFMLGRVLRAWYHKDKNVVVNADASPYKFHEYGCNLIGYEHGSSVAPIRLAALMANECPEAWARTKNGYREWHLGDQHRKGSSKPSSFEEQGVSVEFLPSLTAPNEWHRLKSFNWQKRGAMAFVWDHSQGPISRLQVNVDRYINELMGRGKA